MTSSAVDRFEVILAELEVAPAMLRRDPSGRSWLPPEGHALLDECDGCKAMLAEFVDDELSLLGALDEPLSAPTSDPFFTARVVDALPAAWVPNRLSPRRRLLVLGLFHLIAGLLAFVVLVMVPESTEHWAEQAHRVLSWGSDAGSGLWLTATAIAGAALVALFASRVHTTPTV